MGGSLFSKHVLLRCVRSVCNVTAANNTHSFLRGSWMCWCGGVTARLSRLDRVVHLKVSPNWRHTAECQVHTGATHSHSTRTSNVRVHCDIRGFQSKTRSWKSRKQLANHKVSQSHMDVKVFHCESPKLNYFIVHVRQPFQRWRYSYQQISCWKYV